LLVLAGFPVSLNNR